MTNHYTQMASNQRTLELGEIVAEKDSSRNENITDSQSSSINPFFKNIRVHYNRVLGWERILLILIFVVVLIILTLLIIFMTVSQNFNDQMLKSKADTSEDPCLSLACLQAAVDITKSIDTSVDPCNDFHQFACGKWEDTHILPKGTSRFGTFDIVNAELFKIQKKLLENQNIVDQTSAWAKAIRLYNSCNDIETINRLGAEPLKNHLSRVFDKYGGWSMLLDNGSFPIDAWNLNGVVEDPNVMSPIFHFVVYDDEKDSSRNTIYLNLAALMLEKQYIQNSSKQENKKIIDAYIEFMGSVGSLLGVKPQRFIEFKEVMKLESLLAKLHPTEEEQRDPDAIYNNMTIDRLEKEICPLFNWTTILRKRFQLVNISLPNDFVIVVRFPEILKQICNIFHNYTLNSKSKLILHNYIIWRVINEKAKYLSQGFINAIDKFNKVYRGTMGRRERWETCVAIMQDNMGFVLGNMYISQKFNMRTKPQVLEMINFMKDKFRDNLLSNNWMDAATVHEAIKKINSMLPIIGYTDSSLNRSFIEEHYHRIEIYNDTYFDNIYRINYENFLRGYSKIFKPSENTSIESPQEVNAFYSPQKNEIMFPAGILHNPFFDPEFPRSLKYGAIGSAIGHEITHGFDDCGSKFDFRGNLRSWWTNETRDLFKKKSDCFVTQYSRYSLYGHSINGMNTLGENIADNGGLRLTYQVFKDLETKFGEDKPLPGLKYSHDQLFFISFARIWCNLATKQSTVLTIFSNSHTPNKLRIIGVLSNFNEFAESFKCPIGSPMNPTEKCIVW